MSPSRHILRSLPLLLGLGLAHVTGCTVDFTHTPGGSDAGLDDDAGLNDAGLDDALVSDAEPDAATCISSENVELTCDDGLDNDCDGAADCDDPHCGAQPCDDGNPDTINDTCQAGVCVGQGCVPTEAFEQTCDDGLDNDCTGGADCDDIVACENADCDDGNPDTNNDRCTSGGICQGDPCTQAWVCDQCGTGNCHDVLIAEDPGCGCISSVSVPSCNNVGLIYDVDCGGGYVCTYERQEITQDCNCHWECN